MTDDATTPPAAVAEGCRPDLATASVTALDAVTAALEHGDHRTGQQAMTAAVADAYLSGRHLVVAAGTGTGKTIAYLVPAALSGWTTVVVTATRALQDQLANKDLPFVSAQLERITGHPVDFAVLKGRSNYLCLQRLDELETPADSGSVQLALVTSPEPEPPPEEIAALRSWAERTDTGDRAELEWAPSDSTWRMVSVGSDECPGATRCPRGEDCFAERARARAAVADIVVVNTHLYGQHLRADRTLLGEHQAVIFDEAHVLEDILSDTVGVDIAAGRVRTVSAAVARVLAEPTIIDALVRSADDLERVLGSRAGQRVGPPLDGAIAAVLGDVRIGLQRASEAINSIESPSAPAAQPILRARRLLGRIIDDVDTCLAVDTASVALVSGRAESPRLEIAPLDIGPLLAQTVWPEQVAVLTSATIPSSLVQRLALPTERLEVLDVGSPFDYENNALLYCAMHLPDPRADGYREATHEELAALITAAGGRTLALFTSWSAMDAAVDALVPRLPHRILTQRDLPQRALIEAFSGETSSCLFATAGFFQGVDIPGETLSLVVLDRLPFPRPDDPLLAARRDVAGPRAFAEIDLPRAATMLAQAAGRLIRSVTDRGVVAVLDRRLGAAPYRWDIIGALPPMRRTRDRDEALRFLRSLSG